jgi:PAS domain S-box-containing protein
VAFIGWWAGLPVLSSWASGSAAMSPVTALCLAALGLALMRPGEHWQFAVAAGLVVAAAALLDLGQGLFGIELGVTPALGLALAGGALALGRFERHRFIATGLASFVGVLAVFVLLSYLTGIAALFGPASAGSPALPTSAALLCFACGIIFRIGAMPAPVTPQPLSYLQILLGCAIIAPLLLFGVYAGIQVVDAKLWWRALGWIALVAFSLVVALGSWLGRLIAGALSHVVRAAIALGEGRPLPPNETPVAEVNTLMAEFREAAARRQAFEAALRESEATFRSMFDASSVGKVEVEFETGRILRVNDAMCKLIGYGREELLNRTMWDITHPDEIERDRELIRRLNSGESPVYDMEKRYIRKDGREVWARVTANVILDGAGRPVRCAVIQDLTARKQAEQALQTSKDRLQLAFDATQLGWWQYDPLHRLLSGDERANEIMDVSKEGITVEDIEGKRVHPDDVERVHAAFMAAMDPADPKPLAIEYRIRRGDGTVRWVENHGLVHFAGARPERRITDFVGTIADITERKEREEKERLLIREINHRAKNMLNVVDAIARQTSAGSPEDFVLRFSERVQALSANQDLLVRNEWKGVDVEDLVRAQLAHFADLIGSRITLQDSKLRLNPASAQAIGLALHELATNAGKYGALSTDRGRVDIGWGTDGDTFTMSWTERDGPPVSAPKRRGFGTTVMEAMTARSVDGAVQLDYATSGVSWRLTCPATNVLESSRKS